MHDVININFSKVYWKYQSKEDIGDQIQVKPKYGEYICHENPIAGLICKQNTYIWFSLSWDLIQ